MQYTIGINWLYSNALGGVKLQVMEADAEKARDILQNQMDSSDVGVMILQEKDFPSLSAQSADRRK